MKVSFVFFMALSVLCAQAPPDPNRTLATIDGKPVTAADVKQMLQGAPPLFVKMAQDQPVEYLRWMKQNERLTAEAEKSGLDKELRPAAMIAWSREFALGTAEMNRHTEQIVPTEAEMRAYYAEHPYDFGSVKVKLLYVASKSDGGPAKLKAESLVKQARAGADFARLVKLNSDDQDSAAQNGDFGVVDAQSKIPANMKEAIFKLPQGGVTDAMYREGGYYIFSVTSKESKSYEEIRPRLPEIVKEARAKAWMEDLRKQIEVKFENENFLNLMRLRAAGAPGLEDPQPNEPKPEDSVIRLNGKPFTAADFKALVLGLSPSLVNNLMRDTGGFFQQYALIKKLAELGQAEHLDQDPTVAGALRYSRQQNLAQARLDDYLKDIVVTVDEQRKGYEERVNQYRFVTGRVIQIGFNVSPPPGSSLLNEEQAKTLIDSVAKQAAAGIDFVELVSKYSEDQDSKSKGGQFGMIRASDQNIPEEIKKLLFEAKADSLVGPVKFHNSFYLFRLEQSGSRAYEEVKDEVLDLIRQERWQKWLDGVRTSFDIKLVDAAGFREAVGP